MSKIKGAKFKTILGIETSCDETSIAVLTCSGGLAKPHFKIKSNVISSQVKLHAPYGGVVPNLAKREHIKNLPIILQRAIRKAGVTRPEKEIDALAVTVGPGLEPALWTGINFAQKLAQDWQLPVVAVNHMEGHLVTPLLNNKQKVKIDFPVIALLVSGGHTSLVFAKNWLSYKTIGETVDDAAGEAFDKVARMMHLSYPGGPLISKLARTGNCYTFAFPRPMIHSSDFNFSFSGLKTAVLYTLRDLKEKNIPYTNNDIAASFEEAVADVLILKTIRALREYKIKTLIVGGGVSANRRLRIRIRRAVDFFNHSVTLALPPARFTGDNAAMIAAAAYLHALKKDYRDWRKLKAHATLKL
ncbi:MAG: tRNA (adenosine(37)-N6)-threonylcarbamoyltransferase complex transferase subunit TsaD [Candidatus Ryanbacteria bacterium RIFCSPLOWO2_12_FULL_47_9c]|uniref:tRNA N6-adenosine threonylcarbamoyltransferase n=1 Tax=Candidatus Ryanbacteria bacterium RIFCSPLOWO2_12_FULL_47_9c TaxID=1802131 RepID=A0A1G2H5B8_9BACT|nr:MAG: tRNA (adenosine(37)-N6)-threonylcarbamoyltransferase complex transferase subunit TsaD [Candidatus Ryanbacteria bacterium RIFCSPLOWO2_12_FULL_47_9c]